MKFGDDATPAGGREIRLPKKAEKVKNKTAASLQITAEQLLREAKERELEVLPAPPKVRITDPEELAVYNRKKRKEFEDGIRKNRMQIANWVKYAKFEEAAGEMQRARSVFERSLDVDHRSITLWLQYAEMEMRNRQINHARNIWDRAVTILPRAAQFWLKYSYMEELVENVPGARQVFERWMEWEPDEQAWFTYINFELRYKEVDRARQIYQRFLHVHGHHVRNWVRYARFEERNGAVENARAVYERAIDYFGEEPEHLDEALLIAFGQFEERQKEFERARTIYRYGMDRLSAEHARELIKAMTVHEKKWGSRASIEAVVDEKRKRQYEERVRETPFDYDAWFDYLRLLLNEQVGREQVEDCFEQAIANIPPYVEKRFWRRYIWLWIYYAVYEELDCDDATKAREVWRAALELIPHKKFTFAKVWVMFAQFELRQLDLDAARKVMGVALGKCAKKKLFTAYIEMELQLREFDRCRRIYEKFLEFSPDNSMVWIKFAELESLLEDEERARAIFKLAVQQPALDMPEVLWKAYIDFESKEGEHDKVRVLYESLLQRTTHIKVWISWVEFELSIGEVGRARELFARANRALESATAEERLLLLERWRDFERSKHGDAESLANVERLMPKKARKRRQIIAADGTDAGWEEYFDYIFPQDASMQSKLRLLEAARLWREKQQKEQQEEAMDGDEEEMGREGDAEKQQGSEAGSGNGEEEMEEGDGEGSSDEEESSEDDDGENEEYGATRGSTYDY